jgi:hypothetical protein
MNRSGGTFIAAEYGIADVDGKTSTRLPDMAANLAVGTEALILPPALFANVNDGRTKLEASAPTSYGLN